MLFIPVVSIISILFFLEAACYVSSLLHMALERGDLAEAIAKARKLVELYQVGQLKNK